MLELSISSEGLRRVWWIHLASSIGAVVGRFAIGVLLARLLVPTELGLYATASAIVAAAQLLRDLGVSTYVQREPQLDVERFRSCVGLQIAGTAVVGTALMLGADLLAGLLHTPALTLLIRILTLGFVVMPFSSLMAALQIRALEASRIAWVSRLGTLVWGLASIGFAQQGHGALGLAWAELLRTLVCAAAYWWMRPRELSWLPRWTGWRAVLRFGSGAMGSNLLAGLHNLLPELLLGRLGGVSQVALLGRANAVVGSFQSVAGAVIGFGTLPLMARQHAAGAALAPGLCHASALLTGLAWPLLAWIALQREALVHLLFGPAWAASAGAVLPLALAAAVALAVHHAGLALTAIGRPHLVGLLTAAHAAARIGLALVLYDSQLASFAWALCAAALLILPLQQWLFSQHLQLGIAALARASLPSLLVTAISTAAAAGCQNLAASAAGALFGGVLALRLSGHPLWAELADQLVRLRSTIRK